MAYHHQQPVNFNDSASDIPGVGRGPSRKTPAPSTAYSLPGISRPVSGITAEDPFSERDEYGRSGAETVAQEYLQDGQRTSQGSMDDVGYEHPQHPGHRDYDDDMMTHSAYPYGSGRSEDAMTYVDENFNSYSNRRGPPPQLEDSKSELAHDAQPRSFHDLEYSEPYQPPANPATPKSRFLGLFGRNQDKYPLDQQIEAKRRGSLVRQSRPYVCWTLTLVMIVVLIYELVRNSQAQGTPFSMKPYVNPLLGPSQATMINIGARFVPCMRNVEEVPPTLQLGCPANTANPPTILCSVEQLCGHGGFKDGTMPNQWWRFITPIFLHAGLVHLLVNMFVQCTVGAQVEKEVGSLGFVVIYFAAGIFGNVLGGNFALVGLPSVGASGAIFGTVGSMWVDLVAHWRFEHRPLQKLLMLSFELVFGIALGFLPGTDNFAHIGGFCLGLLSSVVVYPIISETKRHATIVLVARGIAISGAIIMYVVLTRNFYTSDPYRACSWCRYLSCIPSAMNDHCQGTGIAVTE